MSAGSPVTRRADAFVAARVAHARSLASRMAPLVDRPDVFALELEAGFRSLADPDYLEGLRAVTPGLRDALGVRAPLVRPVHASVRRACRGRPGEALALADRLVREPYLEVRLLAGTLLRGTMEAEPEPTWRVIRRLGREADNWIAVDTLAGVVALGILVEPFRWAELEQLAYSPSPWERRLVGSTIATLPFEVVPADRRRLSDPRALGAIGQLIGDADENVQKALSWALRSWWQVEPAAVEAFLEAETGQAADRRDGYRAWVLRDALAPLPDGRAAELRRRLAGIRRVPGGASTSAASAAASAFADFIDRASPAAAGHTNGGPTSSKRSRNA